MKFKLVKVGEAFEFEGKQFVKTSPVVATCQENGEQKLIRRSAEVVPTGVSAKQKPAYKTRQISSSDVRIAFNAFYAECESCMRELASGSDESLVRHLDEKLQNAKNTFLAKIS